MKKYTENQLQFLIKLGQNIRHARVLRGITQQDISAITGIEESQLSRIENGKTNATINSIKKIADTIKTTMLEVFEGI
jgi:transcriptional regulator with XRE-family HTH domain